jgi:hypothetical protein
MSKENLSTRTNENNLTGNAVEIIAVVILLEGRDSVVGIVTR